MDHRELALRLGLALAIGFITGLERGWKDRDEEDGGRTAGLRTFSLIGLLGGILGALSLGGDRMLLTAGFIVTGASLAVFMWREGERERDLSATSLIAALLTFVLGAFAVMGDMMVAAGTSIAMVLLLAHKIVLHGWLARLTWRELRSGLLLAAMTFIALPLLPDRAIDPWGAINPHSLWLMTILIAAISFAGYAAVKLAGPERGVYIAAALGGLFASTAVTLALARLARSNRRHMTLFAGGILAAGCVMMLRVLVITGLLNFQLAMMMAPPLFAAAAVSALSSLLFVRLNRRNGKDAPQQQIYKNPFELGEVLRFGVILAIVGLAVVLARQYFGDQGLLAVAALSGVADVDALTLSVARMKDPGNVLASAILLTVAVNTVAKSVYAWVAGGMRLGLVLLAQNAVTIAMAGLVFYVLA
jgi:uncharacterized membrane protein (DUF4010 family)